MSDPRPDDDPGLRFRDEAQRVLGSDLARWGFAAAQGGWGSPPGVTFCAAMDAMPPALRGLMSRSDLPIERQCADITIAGSFGIGVLSAEVEGPTVGDLVDELGLAPHSDAIDGLPSGDLTADLEAVLAALRSIWEATSV